MSLQKFLASRTGKRFYNFCYCWGACLIILGAVSKIAHFPYDNLFLMIGLFTEVFIFFISGFDEPSREYKWERVFPMLDSKTTRTADMDNGSYQKELARLEENIKKLNEAYEAQLKQMGKQIESMNNSNHQELNAGTRQMAEYIEQLNKQYKQMLDAMNVKK